MYFWLSLGFYYFYYFTTLETQKNKYRSSFSTPNVLDFQRPRATILQPIKNLHAVYPPESFTLVRACIQLRVGQISV